MKKLLLLIFILPILFLTFSSCEESTPTDELDPDKAVTLSGQVVNSETSDPIDQATLIAMLNSAEHYGTTDQDGLFEISFELEAAEPLLLVASKADYLPDTISFWVTPGNTYDNLPFELATTSQTVLPSGDAASIILAGVYPASIGVQESGSPEVAAITFEVQDSMGVPIDINHTVTVNFYIGASPGGDAFLNPSSSVTGYGGQATTYLFSGDSAGVVQIIAIVDQDGETLQSKPVTVTIHGGLPDLAHFGLAAQMANFPGYNIYGLTNSITAYLGDKYGNPVRLGTPVYFTSTGGIIEGSSVTDLMGTASVKLLSAAPKPYHEIYGAGFATVTGRTVDENQNTIENDILVLFSGLPQISVSPTTINVPDKGSQHFTYIVSDQNGNPLAAGTSISVVVEKGNVEAFGNTDITLPDTQSSGWTVFDFILEDSETDTLLSNSVNVKISTSGPNGAIEYFFSGTSE